MILSEHLYAEGTEGAFSPERLNSINYNSSIRLDTLDRIAGMNPRYFCRYFRSMTERTPIDYLNYYRIECACEMLSTRNISIREPAGSGRQYSLFSRNILRMPASPYEYFSRRINEWKAEPGVKDGVREYGLKAQEAGCSWKNRESDYDFLFPIIQLSGQNTGRGGCAFMIVRKISRWKLKSQILFAMVLLVSFASVFLSLTNWGISRSIIERNYKKTNESNIRSFNSAIDYKLQIINGLVRAEFFRQYVYEALLDDVSAGRYFRTYSVHSLDKAAQNLELQSNLIDAVFVFSNSGKHYQHFRGNPQASPYLKYYGSTDVTETDWYRAAQEARGRECYFGYDVLNPEKHNDKISLVKEIRDTSTLIPLGMVVIFINKSFLRSSLEDISSEFRSNTLMIMDPRSPDQLVYLTGSEKTRDEIASRYLENGADSSGKYLYTSCSNRITGWEVVNGIDREDLGRDSAYIGSTMVVTGTFILLLSVLLSGMISRKLYRPLHQLELVLSQVRQGNRHIEEEFDDSEIGRVGNILKETVNHNIELKERILKMNLKERESELLLLQSQINPHFLYNTLDSIYCQAMLKGEEGIASMVNNLSETFKISLNNGQQIISIGQEMEYIRRYMEIQNVRYEGRFELLMEIDEDLMELHIIKLILQPFVENAMYHGLEKKPGPGFIEMKGERMENDLYFTVSDNGIGIQDPQDIYSGFGIRNVEERIRLFYGEEYGITVSSRYGFGTKVNIHIPVMEEEKENDDSGNCG